MIIFPSEAIIELIANIKSPSLYQIENICDEISYW